MKTSSTLKSTGKFVILTLFRFSKWKVSISVVALVIFLLLPGAGSAQKGMDTLSLEEIKKAHYETPEGIYSPLSGKGVPTSPPYRVVTPNVTTVQVNVNVAQQNIVGDAANEPSIAIDVTNPNKMAIGWRQFNTVTNNFRQAGYAYTTNGGQTWTFPGVLEPGVFRSDPVLGSDASGNFYFNSLKGEDFTCQVFRSTDGGASWGTGIPAKGGDKQWMTIDNTNSTGRGHIHSDWNYQFTTCSQGQFTRSTDEGDTYEDCTRIPGDPFWGTLDVGPQGELYVAGISNSLRNFVVVKSLTSGDPDQSVTWESPVSVSLGGPMKFGGGIKDSPNPGGLLGQVWISVDRSAGLRRGYVYLLCSVASNIEGNDPLDIMFVRSTDGGATWSSPVRINDDINPGAWQWFGTMSLAPNGRIDAVWLDTRDNPGSLNSSLYYACSYDGGINWSPNIRLSESFDPHIGWPQQNKMGDYFDMVSDNVGANLVWAATFNSEQDVYYSRITPPAPPAPLLTGTAYAGTTGTNACKANAVNAAPFSAANAIQGYSDNCGGTVTAFLTNTVVTGTDCNWTVTYTFSVKGNCNNILTNQSYSNTGSDQTAPALTGTAYTGTTGINACIDNAINAAPFNAANVIQGYSDNCGGTVTAFLTNVDVTGTDCNWTVTYIFSVRDACNNTLASQSYSNTGGDQTAPALTGTAYTGTTGINACKDNAVNAAPFNATNAIQGYTDNCSGTVTALLTNTVVSGSDCNWRVTYTFSVRDDCNNILENQSYSNTGGDQTPPIIIGEYANPVSLWPPNHTMKDIYIGYTATDNCSAITTTTLSVSSNEPSDGTGEGDLSPDWIITDSHNLKLRAERAGNGKGRIYAITITATDGCNTTTKTVTVVVAHNITVPVTKEPDITTTLKAVKGLEVNVTPNPTKTEFILTVNSENQKDLLNIRVLNINGQLVKEMKGTVSQTYHFGNNLRQGTHMVEVIQGDKRKTLRLIKF